MPVKFNWLTLLANIFSLQFTEISEYQPSSSYRASKSRFFPYIHCKFCPVCPTSKMTSATVKPSILLVMFGLRFVICGLHSAIRRSSCTTLVQTRLDIMLLWDNKQTKYTPRVGISSCLSEVNPWKSFLGASRFHKSPKSKRSIRK